MSIHNERFVLRMVQQARQAMIDGDYQELKAQVLGRYYGKAPKV